MSTNLEVGAIVDGKVTSIKPFGAFVAVNEETQGLVHISQIRDGFVKDINEHLSVGDEVKVKVLSIDEATKKISLSIREANPEAKEKTAAPRKPRGAKAGAGAGRKGGNSKGGLVHEEREPFNTMAEQLQGWLKDNNV